jgi:signal transduction histidine kinase
MLLYRLNPRDAFAVRTLGLALLVWSMSTAHRHPSTSGRGLLIAVLLVLAVVAWVAWMVWPTHDQPVRLELYLMAAAGGYLCGAAPGSAASVFVFVAVVAAGVRTPLPRALGVVAAGVLALAVSAIVYDGSGLGLLAYALGFVLAVVIASGSRLAIVRAEQAELLLAQTQRSHEEALRAARLEESTRIAREIHDVLAHALAGLAIQLEATSALVERGAERDVVLARLQRAYELAREGLRETRRAVGALRGDGPLSTPLAIEALVADYRVSANAPVTLTIDGEESRLCGAAGQAIVRVAQEALTNARKHAPGAEVAVTVHAGEQLVLVVDNGPGDAGPSDPAALAGSGGGYGVKGMRERAELLGATQRAGAERDGWRVELRLPGDDRP